MPWKALLKNNLADYQKVFNGLQETELPDLEDVAWNIDRRAKSLMRVTTYEQGSHVRGLLDLVEALNDDELAFLLAHEYHQAQTGRLQKKARCQRTSFHGGKAGDRKVSPTREGYILCIRRALTRRAAVSALNTMEGFQSPNLLPNRRRKLLERVGLKTHPDVSKRRDYLEREAAAYPLGKIYSRTEQFIGALRNQDVSRPLRSSSPLTSNTRGSVVHSFYSPVGEVVPDAGGVGQKKNPWPARLNWRTWPRANVRFVGRFSCSGGAGACQR